MSEKENPERTEVKAQIYDLLVEKEKFLQDWQKRLNEANGKLNGAA